MDIKTIVFIHTLPTIAEITQTELIWELKCGFLNR